MPDQWVLHDGPPARLMKQTVLHQGGLARDAMLFDAGSVHAPATCQKNTGFWAYHHSPYSATPNVRPVESPFHEAELG